MYYPRASVQRISSSEHFLYSSILCLAVHMSWASHCITGNPAWYPQWIFLFTLPLFSQHGVLSVRSTPGIPILHLSQSLLKLMSLESVMPFSHLILCCPLLLLPSVFPRIRVFSNELALPIRWPKYWSFSFSISSSNEYSGLIDWFDLLAF